MSDERTEEKIKLIDQWLMDVCYPPRILTWQESEFYGWDWIAENPQPDWRKLPFENWLKIVADLPSTMNEDCERIIRRPSFQGWATQVFKSQYEGKCMASSCDKVALIQIAWNCWGTCCEAFVCQEHSFRHGVWTDSL